MHPLPQPSEVVLLHILLFVEPVGLQANGERVMQLQLVFIITM